MGQPVTDADGVVLRGFRQGKAKLGTVQRIDCSTAMKHQHLDQLAVAGGKVLRCSPVAKRVALLRKRHRDRRATRRSRN